MSLVHLHFLTGASAAAEGVEEDDGGQQAAEGETQNEDIGMAESDSAGSVDESEEHAQGDFLEGAGQENQPAGELDIEGGIPTLAEGELHARLLRGPPADRRPGVKNDFSHRWGPFTFTLSWTVKQATWRWQCFCRFHKKSDTASCKKSKNLRADQSFSDEAQKVLCSVLHSLHWTRQAGFQETGNLKTFCCYYDANYL